MKPLDIVWAEIECDPIDYFHVGIYLGDNKVCHAAKKHGAKITSWEEFLEGATGRLIRYHSVVPFKHYKLIAKQIDWAAYVEYRKEKYDLLNRNCEHFANKIIYGIDYSGQIREKSSLITKIARVGKLTGFGLPGLLLPDLVMNNNEVVFKLTEEIDKNNQQLGRTSLDWYRRIEQEARISFPPKQDCKIM